MWTGRFVEVDWDGVPTTFEIRAVGEKSIQLACEYNELGGYVWKPV